MIHVLMHGALFQRDPFRAPNRARIALGGFRLRARSLAHGVRKVVEPLAKSGNVHAPAVLRRLQEGPPEVRLRECDRDEHTVR